MQYYFLIFAAVVLLSLQFSTNRAYELKQGNAAVASLFFTAMTGFASAAVCLVIAIVSGEALRITPFSLLMALLIAIFSCTYTFIGFKIMAFGSLSVFSMFLMLGGMLCPYLFGVFMLDEGVSVARIIGVLLLVLSMVFPVIAKNKSGGKGNAVFFLLCAAVFLLNGGVSITSKIHQITTDYEIMSSAAFSFTANLVNGVFSSALLAVFALSEKKKAAAEGKTDEKCKLPVGKAVALLILANAACNGVSYTLQLISAGKVDASAMYPMMTGGSVVLSAVAGRIFFGEKPDKISLFGIVLAFAATFLFLF